MANLNSKVYYESVPALGALPVIDAKVMAKLLHTVTCRYIPR